MNEVFEVIERIRADGTTIVLVEQNARRALGLADHGYLLCAAANSCITARAPNCWRTTS